MKSKILFTTLIVGSSIAFVEPVSAQLDSAEQLVPLLELTPIVTDTTPPVITNVLAVSVLPTEETITWTTDELADSRLEYGTTLSYGSQATLDVSLTLLHSAALLGLAPSTTYYYCVHSKDAAGNEASDCGRSFVTAADPVTVITVPPDTTAPVITNVFGVSVVPTEATITWTTDELADSRLEYGTTLSYGTQATLDVSLLLAHSATLLGLTPSTTYYFCVHSKDAAGNNASECGRSFITADNPIVVAVPPPIISAITTSLITSTSASIIWSTDTIADSQVEFGVTDAYGQFTALDLGLDVNHSAVLSNLLPGTQYHFRVKSTDQTGQLATSGDNSFTTAPLDIVPIPSTDLIDVTGPVILGISASTITANDATITLTTSELAVVQIEFGESTAYGNLTPLSSSLDWIHVQWLAGLSPNTRYHYRVRAIDASGNFTLSGDLEFTSLAVSVVTESVPIISGVSVTPVGANGATITWTTDVSANSQVEYGLSNAYGATTEVNSLLSTSHQVTITGLVPNTTYHFRVKSQEDVGNTGISTDFTFTTEAVLAPLSPRAVGDLTLNNVDQTSATLSWTVPTNNSAVLHYHIRYATYPLTTNNFNDVENIHDTVLYVGHVEASGISHEYTIVGLTPGTKYYFAVQAVDLDTVASPISNVASAVTHFAQVVGGATPINFPISNGGVGATGSVSEAPSGGPAVEVIYISDNGIGYRVDDTTAPGQPIDVKAQPLDSQIAFFWTNPNDKDFLRLRILRKIGSYPDSYADGVIIYEGDAETSSDGKAVFTDTGLVNNQTYYYGFYAYDDVPNFSAPVRLSVAPKAVRQHTEYVVIPAYLDPIPSITLSKNLSFGMVAHEIEHVQELLATDPTLYPAGHIDGYYGPIMKRAITKLQARHGLVQNGKIDAATRLKILELSKLHQIVETPLKATALVLARDLFRGTSGTDVRYLQKFLRDRGFYPEGLTTGVFDHPLEHAVMRFKKQYGIEPISGYTGIYVRKEIQRLKVG